MDWSGIFNNASVSAFFGAFFAFLLVALTDWRRNRRKRKLIVRQLSANNELAAKKQETVKKNLSLLKDHNKATTAPIMRFPVEDIRKLETEVLDLLTVDQKMALDSIIYTYEATDGLLLEITDKLHRIEDIQDSGEPILPSNEMVKKLPADYEDAYVNLGRAIDMASLYIKGRYREVLNKKYNRDDYLPKALY
ncbi:MAG: hypothetical protein AABY87_06500 [bacterium]